MPYGDSRIVRNYLPATRFTLSEETVKYINDLREQEYKDECDEAANGIPMCR
jgi:hypothetical protein